MKDLRIIIIGDAELITAEEVNSLTALVAPLCDNGWDVQFDVYLQGQTNIPALVTQRLLQVERVRLR